MKPGANQPSRKPLWKRLSVLAARQSLFYILQVAAAAALGVGSTYFAWAYIENLDSLPGADNFVQAETTNTQPGVTIAAAAPSTGSAETCEEEVPAANTPQEWTTVERALYTADTSVRMYIIRHTCGHTSMYSPDPAECRDVNDVIAQVEYLNSVPCADCIAKDGSGGQPQ